MTFFDEKYFFIKGKIAIVLVLVWLTSGCALTSPASERLVFRQEEKRLHQPLFPQQTYSPSNEEKHSSIFTPSVLLYYLKMTFRPPLGELKYAKTKFAPFIAKEFDENPNLTTDDLTIRNPYYFSLSLPVSLIQKPAFYWSMNVGYPVLSTDITVNLGKGVYSTANLGVAGGEFILQKKLLHTDEQLGIAIGGYYRAERRGFEITSNEVGPSLVIGPIVDMLAADRIFYTHTIGPRLNSLIPLNDHSFIHARIAPGYSITLKEAVFNVGFTLQLSTN